MKKIFIIFITVLSFSLVLKAQETGTFTDTRDSKIYKTVKIDSQTWMAENLDYSNKTGCWEHSWQKRGKLYTYDAAKTSCPTGWHIPTLSEWNTLITYAGGESVAGKNLKSTAKGWSKMWKCADLYGFNAYGSGVRDHSTGIINRIDERAYFWTGTSSTSDNAKYIMIVDDDIAIKSFDNLKTGGMSVRCVKD